LRLSAITAESSLGMPLLANARPPEP
jgi:hypothetical protein